MFWLPARGHLGRHPGNVYSEGGRWGGNSNRMVRFKAGAARGSPGGWGEQGRKWPPRAPPR
eukprot:8446352-Prorocentrum_lima.AAC.1